MAMHKRHAIIAAILLIVAASSSLLVAAQNTCGSSFVFTEAFDIVGDDLPGAAPIVTNNCACSDLCNANAACRLKAPSGPASSTTIFVEDPETLRFPGALEGIRIGVPRTTTNEANCIATCISNTLCRYVVFTAVRSCSLYRGTVEPLVRIGIRGTDEGPVTSVTTSSAEPTTSSEATSSATASTRGPSSSATARPTGVPNPSGTLSSGPATSASSASPSRSTSPTSTDTSQNQGTGGSASDNKNLVTGLGVAGAFVGILLIGAGVVFFYRMNAKRKERINVNDKIFNSSVGVGAASTAATTAAPPTPAKDDKPPVLASSDVGSVAPSSAMGYSNYSVPAPVPANPMGNPYGGYYPPMPVTGPGYVAPYMAPTQADAMYTQAVMQQQAYMTPPQVDPGYAQAAAQPQAFTVEQYMASGWTMEQINAFQPPIAK
ncbi:hypothetical protein BC829DRAFT_493993 [Chytridium lagenaria]|nr:hypothetical protein BC829DRAFT_493993 [Chytridium lagenaria]